MEFEINTVHRKGKGIAKEWLSMTWNKNVVDFRFENFAPELISEQVRKELGSYYTNGGKINADKIIQLLKPYLPEIAKQAIELVEKFDPSIKPKFSSPGPSLVMMKKNGKRNPHHI